MNRLTADFQTFLGADARAVVTGLRNGTPITLIEAAPRQAPGHPPATRTVTINSPARKMSHESVYIALSLAMRHLGRSGVFQPTPSQLQAVFLGGSVTNRQGVTTRLQGVLTLRSQGKGWFRIADLLGTRLAPVISGRSAASPWPAAENLGRGAAGSSGGSLEARAAT